MSRDPRWWHDGVVYQVYPRSFADSDGDGVGDLRGVIDHVDHLAWLGVDVLWLSPVYRSPMDDNGYDVSDYRDVDPLFGTLADLDEMVAVLAHRGIRLMMDVVVNHTSDEHPWFLDSRTGGDRKDWYHWRPPREGHTGGEPGAEPTDLQSLFGGSAWEWDAGRGEYYLHLFSRKQPDLNWDNGEVRAEVHDLLRWWLDRGVCGFRMDVINLIAKPDEVRDGMGLEDLDQDKLHRWLHELHHAVLAGRDTITVGEAPGVTSEQARLLTDAARQEVDMVFTFEHMQLDEQNGLKFDVRPLHLPDLKANLAQWQEALAESGWNSLYWCNHDQPRVVSRFGDDGEHRVASAKTLATTLHFLRGTPYVYQGEEIGMTNAPFTSIGDYRDLEAVNFHRIALELGAEEEWVLAGLAAKGRDHARTPMQWDATEGAGFSTGQPWLPVNPDHTTVNVEAARADPGSVLHHYRELVRLRHELPVMVRGRFDLLLPDDERLFAYTRTLGDQVLTVVANWSGDRVPVPAGLPEGDLLLATHADGEPGVLEPWESRVLARNVQPSTSVADG